MDLDLKAQVIEHWRGTLNVLFTLFKAISGGGAWGGPATVLLASAGPVYFTIFLFFVSLAVFAVLRVLTGIFCTHATQASVKEKEVATLASLYDLCCAIDSDGSGTISSDELQEHLADAAFDKYIRHLGIGGDDVLKIFRALQTDSDAEVKIEDLLRSFMRLRGPARHVDTEMLMFALGNLQDQVSEMQHRISVPKG